MGEEQEERQLGEGPVAGSKGPAFPYYTLVILQLCSSFSFLPVFLYSFISVWFVFTQVKWDLILVPFDVDGDTGGGAVGLSELLPATPTSKKILFHLGGLILRAVLCNSQSFTITICRIVLGAYCVHMNV